MEQKEFEIYSNRIRCFHERISKEMYGKSVEFSAEYGLSKEPVKWKDRLSLSYRPVKEGDLWGSNWESGWFRLTAVIPETFAGKDLCLQLNFGGETLIFDANGVPVYGLSGGTEYSNDFKQERMDFGKHRAGEKIELWVEAAANRLFGMLLDPNDPKHPYGHHEGYVLLNRITEFRKEVWQLAMDVEILRSLLEVYGLEDYRGKKILAALTNAVDAYSEEPENAKLARECLKECLALPAMASALELCAIGHAHIDVGWLWPVRESIRKAARTFSRQLALMEEYPDYKFGASQPQLYQFVKDNYPELYAKIKERVKEGRWELQGGMWVEADANIISGESMIRQFIHGKNFFRDEFGIEVKNLWLPDVFGYSAAMPQILKKSGCDYFLTQKLSWSQFNTFPHTTFRWKGVDGSSVITHFPPENTYNSMLIPKALVKEQNAFKEADKLDKFMCLCGIGDGGGGPFTDLLERAKRERSLEGLPKVKFERADRFFDYLSKKEKELPVWNGELYLELHRGTLTTQSRTKRGNRKCEQALAATEFISAHMPLENYPEKELDHAWKTLLLNQFHDIIPGSSINQVYQTTEKEHKEILDTCKTLIKQACQELFHAQNDSAVLINTLSYPYNAAVKLPESWNGCGVKTMDEKEIAVQNENGQTVAAVELPPLSFVTIRKSGKVETAAPAQNPVLENAEIRYEFSEKGTLLRAYDKTAKREVLGAPGNLLSLYNDIPNNWDAWDIDIFYRHNFKGHPEAAEWRKTAEGPVRSKLEFTYRFGKSEIKQEAVLNATGKRLDFHTVVEWQEDHKMLRTEFPTTIDSADASFDIQYAFVKRATHDNTTWDLAKFEVTGQRYADLSACGYGAALLNDCKYGYRVKGSTLDLNLLRSPKSPDRFADLGKQEFTYSFLPHEGNLTESEVMREAACLNREPCVADGFESNRIPFCGIESDGVTLEVLKKTEKGNRRAIRLTETHGLNSKAVLTFSGTPSSVRESDLLEWKTGENLKLENNRLELVLSPFEIKTFLVE